MIVTREMGVIRNLMTCAVLALAGASAFAQDKEADFERLYSEFVLGEAVHHDDPSVAATYAALEESTRFALKRELTQAERDDISRKVAATFAAELGVDEAGAKRVFRERMFALLSDDDMHLAATLLASPQGLRIRQAVTVAGTAMDAYLVSLTAPASAAPTPVATDPPAAPAAPVASTALPQAARSPQVASPEVVYANLRIDVRAGQFQEYSEQFVSADDTHAVLMDVDFERLQPNETWLPVFALCVSADDPHVKDCMKIVHETGADHLHVNFARIRSGASATKLPTVLLPTSLPVEGRFRISASVGADNVIVFRLNGADLLRHGLEFTPTRYSYVCSSMLCDIRMLHIERDTAL